MAEASPRPFALTAAPADAGQRVDRFLADATGLSRARVKTLIEQGHAARDGRPLAAPAEPVRAGSCYVLTPPAPAPAMPGAEAIPLDIRYEDADLLVLDKPAGLVVHPAPGNQTGTLVNALLAHCGDALPGIGGERRPGIVHRLDKDTSGLMVVAKSEKALAALAADFAARTIERAYLALVWGLPSPGEGTIEGAIGRDPRERKRMALRRSGGKPALTRYRTLATYGTAVALLECRLATGRTHQIRVHLASQGHPLVGDAVYLRRIPAPARTLPEPLRGRLLDFPRQALHAAELGFIHPRTGARLRFKSAPPPDLKALLAALGMEKLNRT
jgi:23S rRNA pseudouridine1911/1915/1917 synthase